MIWVDGHSDYGHAFETFWDRWGREVNSKTTVLLLGDARNNYHASQAWVLAEIAKKARHVYWLNPEPRSYWDTGDSIVSPVRHPLRRGLRVPQPQAAGALRRTAGVLPAPSRPHPRRPTRRAVRSVRRARRRPTSRPG